MTKEDQDVEDYYAGDSLTIKTTVYESSAEDTAVDLSGASAAWTLTDRFDDSALVEKTTSGGGVSITDAVNGKVEIYIDPADTESLEPGWYEQELEVTSSAGDVSTVLIGSFEIKPSQA